ncbi:MAG: hypothetical protein MUO63_19480 [Desulfobulbaceae bacterium]|nr:hypothetical protein [Desulfobulbaceae bacterium]
MNHDFPNWLKSNQNGSIGEIRTKSFLMNRFWLLERSVDIHGADFLIQRRIYGKNILDDEPTRFGVVQSKFSQDEHTTHKIKKEYILDREDNPRTEFFLIIHTGNEEEPEMYLLNSKDISEDFETNVKGEYIISSKSVFASPKYKITNKKKCLDRIETSIQCAEFFKNRLYAFQNISSTNPDFDAIQPEYKEDIEHWFGYIPETFKKQKKEVFDVMLTLEQIHEYFVSFLESVDPLEACIIAEEWEYNFGSSIKFPEIYDPNISDFYHIAKEHKEMVNNMRNDGALDNFFFTKKSIISEINVFFQSISNDQIGHSSMHEISIEYESKNLKFIGIKNSLISKQSNENQQSFSSFIKAKEGAIILTWKVGLQLKHDGILKMNEVVLNDIMEKIYALKYYEGCEV